MEDFAIGVRKVDNLDVRIIRAMLESRATSPIDFSLKKSLTSLAKQIKVDENTVKNRIEKLYESKFLRGWWVALNPNLVGEKMAQLWFDVKNPFAKEEVIERISLMPGIAAIKNLFGSSLSVILYHEGDKALEMICELISKIAESKEMIVTNEPFPPCSFAISSDDLRIIRAFQRDPMKSYVQVANELRLSPRTVKRRISKLSDEEALYLVAEMKPKFLNGGIASGLLVFYDSPDLRHEANESLLGYIKDRLLFANLDDIQHGYFAIMINNISQAKEILRWAQQVPGIARGRIDLVEEIFYRYEVYEEQLNKIERNPLYAKVKIATR